MKESFGRPYYDLLHAVAWVHAKLAGIEPDTALEQVVSETEKRAIGENISLEHFLSENASRYPGGLTWPDRYDAQLMQAASEALHEQIRKDANAPNWFDVVESAVSEALQRGEIIAYGIKDTEGDVMPVPSIQWLDLRLHYGPARARSKNYFSPDAETWNELSFKREALQKLWPDPSASGEALPRRLGRRRTRNDPMSIEIDTAI
ncbi:MAG: hypothetical protein HY678_03670, partial [Chloroflexi bacterium]|nr:hypothetical protein [Chloroflexota bacterium]